MKTKHYVIMGVIFVMVGVGGFYAGMKYQQSQRATFMRQFNGGAGVPGGENQFRVNGNRAGFRPVSGEIIGLDDSSITVKLPDKSSRIVLFNDNTSINQAATASAQDLKVGETVAVFGQENTDGSVTAQSIQLNPQDRGFIEARPSTSPQL